jgi:hypothetical protein
VDRAGERFSQRVITLLEWNEMRSSADALDRKRAQARGQAKELEAKGIVRAPGGSARDLARSVAESAVRVANTESRVHWTDPWQLRLAAGVIPLSPVDWYGVVELGFNLGGVARAGHSARYVQARMDEVERAPYEVAAQLRQYEEVLAAAREQALEELVIVERDLETLSGTRHALESAEAPNIAHQRDRLALEELSLQADRAYLRAYADGLGTALERR